MDMPVRALVGEQTLSGRIWWCVPASEFKE
jgi:hypothetical protein